MKFLPRWSDAKAGGIRALLSTCLPFDSGFRAKVACGLGVECGLRMMAGRGGTGGLRAPHGTLVLSLPLAKNSYENP